MAKTKKPTPKELYWAKKRKEEEEKAALLPPGLVNHGNTCFMNSVLQGLVATSLLEEVVNFHDPSERLVHLSSYRRSPLLANGRGPEDVRHEWVQGMTVGDVFIRTMERAWRMRETSDRSSMSPRELLNRLGQKYDQYMDFRQQDAHEFLLHLLDCIRMEELDIIKLRQPRPAPKSSKRRVRAAGLSRKTIPDVIAEEERLVSFVDTLWGGKFISVLICAVCKHISHTYEDFDDLSLSITHDESKERKRDRLRAFASKFMTRPRDQVFTRPQSVSQPPSPALSTVALEPLDAPRRRSFEESSIQEPTPEPGAELRKVEFLAGFKNDVNEDSPGRSTTPPISMRSRKVSDAGLGKLGRRISVGMSLGVRKDKKLPKAEKDQKLSQATDGSSPGIEEELMPVLSPNSIYPSRQPSPTPMKRSTGMRRLPKPSEHEVQKAAYLRRLLEDTAPGLSNPLAALRMVTPNGSGSGASSSSAWLKIGPTQSVEDCLRMFTAVEALEGDNMFGCRNCWKIANGRTSERADSEDSDDSSEQQDQVVRPSQPQVLTAVQSFSTPNLSPTVGEPPEKHKPTLSAMSSPLPIASDPSAAGTVLNLSALDLNVGRSAATSTTSFATTHMIDALSHNIPPRPTSISQDDDEESTPSIPIIATTSPLDSKAVPLVTSQASRPHYIRFPTHLNEAATPSIDSLRLPEARFHHSRDGAGSISSEDSERDDASGISDGEASLGSGSFPPLRDPRQPRRPSLPHSKQVIYQRALKRYLIARPPPLLVIHLKRFQQVSKSPVMLFGNLKKLDDYVSFPEYLDIRPFLAPKKEDYGLGKGELRGKIAEKGKREEDLPCVYRLYAVVVHIGNMLGGHYIAYTALPSPSHKADSASQEHGHGTPLSPSEKGLSAENQERQWCYISDTVVRLVSLNEVLKAKAYLCMYERVW